MGSRACYGCNQIKNYPRRNRTQGTRTSAPTSIQQPLARIKENQPQEGRAFAFVSGNTPAATSVVLGIFPIYGQPAHILIDSDSIHFFIS